MPKCDDKGNPKRILEFIEANPPLDEKAAKTILEEVEKGRKNSIADRYYGAVKVEKWPKDLDEFAVEQMQKRHKGTVIKSKK